jgi:hypothetical protein
MLGRQCTLVAFTSREVGWNDARTMADRHMPGNERAAMLKWELFA